MVASSGTVAENGSDNQSWCDRQTAMRTQKWSSFLIENHEKKCGSIVKVSAYAGISLSATDHERAIAGKDIDTLLTAEHVQAYVRLSRKLFAWVQAHMQKKLSERV